MIKLDKNNFKEEVLDSKEPVVVDFWAEWCMPCKLLGPIIEELSKEMKGIKFAKLNVDENQDIAQMFFIQGIPTVIVFNNGEEAGRIVGLRDKETLRMEIQNILNM